MTKNKTKFDFKSIHIQIINRSIKSRLTIMECKTLQFAHKFRKKKRSSEIIYQCDNWDCNHWKSNLQNLSETFSPNTQLKMHTMTWRCVKKAGGACSSWKRMRQIQTTVTLFFVLFFLLHLLSRCLISCLFISFRFIEFCQQNELLNFEWHNYPFVAIVTTRTKSKHSEVHSRCDFQRNFISALFW